MNHHFDCGCRGSFDLRVGLYLGTYMRLNVTRILMFPLDNLERLGRYGRRRLEGFCKSAGPCVVAFRQAHFKARHLSSGFLGQRSNPTNQTAIGFEDGCLR